MFSVLKRITSSFLWNILRNPKIPAVKGMIEKRTTILKSIICLIIHVYMRKVMVAKNDIAKIAEKTKLSTATVSKVLKQLRKENKIEKNLDTESDEYPYPVHYKLLPEGAMALAIAKQINFMDDHFVQTKWPKEWVEDALREIISEAYKKKFSLFERLTRNKEDRFFLEVLQKQVLAERVCETALTIFHKGFHPFQVNEGIVRATIQLMLDFFADIVNARKDDEEPVMMVLSYLPTAPKGEQVIKKWLGYFASWAKQFKGVDIKSITENERNHLQAEYLQKFEKNYDSLRAH